MINSLNPLVIAAIAGIIAVLAATIIAFRMGVPLKPKFGWVILSASPSIVMVLLFYSLAIHMFQSLGGWPTSIGERGFSPALATHASVAMEYFSVLLLFGIFVWPAAFVLTVLIRPLRRLVAYLGAYALSYAVCWGLLLVAPSQFLYWWWD